MTVLKWKIWLRDGEIRAWERREKEIRGEKLEKCGESGI